MASSWSSSSTTSTSTLLRLLCLCAALPVALQAAARPPSVTIGALFTFDSVIGRSARTAIQLAVDDVNGDPTVLRGTNLSVIFQDTKCSGFVGTIQGNNTLLICSVFFLSFFLSSLGIGLGFPSLVRWP
jgi:ionotropic glutamate receptor